MIRKPLLKRLVGVVGGAASGKDTVASIFSEYGYKHVSSSDCVREEIHDMGKAASRPLQTQVANQRRLQNGVGYWVDRSLLKAGGAERVVVSGLYAPGEGSHIVEGYGGMIVGVVTASDPEEDLNLRYQRLAQRADGSRDRITFEDFLAAHVRENGGILPHETNIARLLDMATFTVINSGSLGDMRRQVTEIAGRIEEVHQ